MFSIYTNGLKIFTCESIQSSNVIQCIHGIRAIMAMWVITVHTYYIFYLIPSREHIEFIKVIIAIIERAFEFLCISQTNSVFPNISKRIDNGTDHCGLIFRNYWIVDVDQVAEDVEKVIFNIQKHKIVLINRIFVCLFQNWQIGYFLVVFTSSLAVNTNIGCDDSHNNDIGPVHQQWTILAIHDGPFDREL